MGALSSGYNRIDTSYDEHGLTEAIDNDDGVELQVGVTVIVEVGGVDGDKISQSWR